MSTIICNAAVSACEKDGEWEKALGLLSVMAQGKNEMSTIICSAAVSACEKGGEWEKVLGLTPSIVGGLVGLLQCWT